MVVVRVKRLAPTVSGSTVLLRNLPQKCVMVETMTVMVRLMKVVDVETVQEDLVEPTLVNVPVVPSFVSMADGRTLAPVRSLRNLRSVTEKTTIVMVLPMKPSQEPVTTAVVVVLKLAKMANTKTVLRLSLKKKSVTEKTTTVMVLLTKVVSVKLAKPDLVVPIQVSVSKVHRDVKMVSGPPLVSIKWLQNQKLATTKTTIVTVPSMKT